MSLIHAGESHPLSFALSDAQHLLALDAASSALRQMEYKYGDSKDPEVKELRSLRRRLRSIAEKHFFKEAK